MTAEERREKGRLRSERWRRAHGIMPRRKAATPVARRRGQPLNMVSAAQTGP